MQLPQQKQSKRDAKKYQALTHTSYQPARPDHPHEHHRPSHVPPHIPQRKRRFGWKHAFLILFFLLLTPLLVIGIWDYRNFSTASAKLFGTSNALGVLMPSTLQSDMQGRTNILMIGYSADDAGHSGALLTDSILVVSLDKTKNTGYMLSIPRDLYVDIPEYGQAKINEAFQAGETMGFNDPAYSQGGVGLLEQVIHETFGIETHYHAIVNYMAVRETVDALGGVTVTVQSPDARGLYDPNFRPQEGGPLKLPNGPQVVDGQTALRLTRARGSTFGSYGFPLSDFNRTQNQQQVFAAIQGELDWKLVLDPRTNQKIFEAVANNVKTDVQLSELLPLYRLINAVPREKLQPVNLREANGINLLRGYNTPTGQSALIPSAGINNYQQIRALITNLNQQ